MRALIMGAALVALVAGSADASQQSAAWISAESGEATGGQHAGSDIDTADAIVTVRAGRSVGTGFVVGPGEVVTAAHVVATGEGVTVQVAGQRLDARLIAFDPAVDLALLSVASTDLPRLQVAESLPSIGADATAFSAADGVVAATRGIVSAYETVGGVPHLRTDAAVNAGSSGGPVVDAAGQVIGVTVTKAERREGVAHAVTADVVATFLDTRPDAAAPPRQQGDRRTSSVVPRTIGGAFALVLAVALLASVRHRTSSRTNQSPNDIQLGRSRILIDAEAATDPRTGGNDGP